MEAFSITIKENQLKDLFDATNYKESGAIKIALLFTKATPPAAKGAKGKDTKNDAKNKKGSKAASNKPSRNVIKIKALL